jgi:outer membrane immunogenic protein
VNKSIAIVAGFAVAMSISAGAQAADMYSGKDDGWSEPYGSLKDEPYEMPPVWSGLYVGGYIGGGSGDADITDIFEYEADPISDNTIDLSVLIAGVRVGYNVQRGNLVYGIEAGLGTLNFSDSVTDEDLRRTTWDFRNVPKIGATYSMSGGLYGELTGRIGYAEKNTLLYVKGGGAFLQADFDAHYEGVNACTGNTNRYCNGASQSSIFDFSESDTMLGWTVGLGLEYALSSSISVNLEYQHFDFGNMSYGYEGAYSFNPQDLDWQSRLSGDVETDVTLDVVKLGINYKLQNNDGGLQ